MRLIQLFLAIINQLFLLQHDSYCIIFGHNLSIMFTTRPTSKINGAYWKYIFSAKTDGFFHFGIFPIYIVIMYAFTKI